MENSNKQFYAKFILDNDVPIYVKDWYLDLVCGPENWDVAILTRNTDVIASLPYFIKKGGIFKWIGMPLLSKMHGPYFSKTVENGRSQHSIVEDLLEQLPKVDYYQQATSYSFSNWLAYLWRGFSQVTLYSYVFKKLNLDSIYMNMNPDIKRRLRKAESNLQATTNLDFDQFYILLHKTYSRQKLKLPFSKTFLEKFYSVLKEKKACEIIGISDTDNQLCSAALLIWDGISSYYLLEGTDPDVRDKNAGMFVKWKAIEYTKNTLQLDMFDFEGSISRRIEKVYREFGATANPYFVIKKYNSKLFLLVKFLQNYRQYGKLVQW